MTKDLRERSSKTKRSITGTGGVGLSATNPSYELTKSEGEEGDANEREEVGEKGERAWEKAEWIGIHMESVGLERLSTGLSTIVENYNGVVR